MSVRRNSTCSRHVGEPATAFCLKHELSLCTKCLLGAHKVCVHEDNVEYIDKTTERIEKEIPEAIRTYEHIFTTSKVWSEKYQMTLQKLQEAENSLVTGIKQMRDRLIEQTDKLASEALEIIHSVVQDQRSMVQHDVDQLDEFNRKVSDIKSHIDRCKTEEDVVAGELMYVLNTVKNLHAKFQNTELIDRDVKLHFHLSDELQYIRSKLRSFGELSVEDPNCKNTGLRTRPSRISLNQSLSQDNSAEDEIDSRVFVIPKAKAWATGEKNIYCSIHVEEPPTPCPNPPPLPDLHPDMHIEDKIAFIENRDKFQTLPRMKTDNHDSETKRIRSFSENSSSTSDIPIPSLPKKRTSVREPSRPNTEDTTKVHLGERYDKPDALEPSLNDNEGRETKKPERVINATGVDAQYTPKIKVRPPSNTEKIAQMFEKLSTQEPNKLSPMLKKSPKDRFKRILGQSVTGSDGSINRVGRSDIVIEGDEIPPLPRMHKPRGNASRRIDSIVSDVTDDHSRFSDNEFSINNIDTSPNSQMTKSMNNLKDVELKRRSLSSNSSSCTNRSYYSASSSASFKSENKDFDSETHMSDESFTNEKPYVRNKQPEMRLVSPLDTQSRKSVSYNLKFSLPMLNDTPKTSHNSLPHSTITGVAVSSSGILFICDVENHCLQLFDTSGIPLFDYQIREPFSCCTLHEDTVAVTSRDRKSVCIFDISNTKIACRQEQVIEDGVEIYGVGYTKGFLGICCLDRVAIMTEALQSYRTVKPIVMVKKKKSKNFFVDVKYIAMEWSKLGFFIYTSEQKIDRISCVVVGHRDRVVWNCHVGKPKSVLLVKENVLVAAKRKIVVLEAASGQRLREIHNEVPTHPVHMVLWDGWLYMSKNSSSNAESRNIRKIALTSA